MSGTRCCEVTVRGRIARSVIEAIGTRFDVGSAACADVTVLTFAVLDQAAIRAVLVMLWDSGHEVLALSTAD
jgi:hypothetical protein